MAYDQTGPGYSAGVVPDYASKMNDLLQQYQAKNVLNQTPASFQTQENAAYLPQAEQALRQQQFQAQRQQFGSTLAQNQQRLDLERNQQETMLPLQSALTAAEIARQKHQVDLAQQGLDQAPALFNAIGGAKTHNELFQAIAQYPAAASIYQNEISNAQSHLEKQDAIAQQGRVGSAAAIGMSLASKPENIETDFSDPKSFPEQIANDPIQLAAAIQGASQKQAQVRTAQVVNTAKLAASRIRAGATVDAAALKILARGVQNGTVSIPDLESLAPGLGDAVLNGTLSTIPGGNSATPKDPIAIQNLKLASAVLTSPNTKDDPALLGYVKRLVQNSGHDPYANLSPGTIEQLQNIDDQITQTQKDINDTTNHPLKKDLSWGYDTGLWTKPQTHEDLLQQSAELNKQRNQLLRSAKTPNDVANVPPSTTFNRPAISQLAASGNPQTAQALSKSPAPTGSAPAEQPPTDAADWVPDPRQPGLEYSKSLHAFRKNGKVIPVSK